MLRAVHEFYVQGGPFMHFISLVLAVSLAIIIERIIYIVRCQINEEAFWEAIQNSMKRGKVDEAMNLCQRSEAPIPKVYQRILASIKESLITIQSHAEEAALDAIPKMEKRIHHLTTLANVATLLGLLGTIFGLITAFAAVAIADPTQKASMLARGISNALNTTAFGLISAVPILLSFAWLESKVRHTVDSLDHYTLKLLNLIRDIRETG